MIFLFIFAFIPCLMTAVLLLFKLRSEKDKFIYNGPADIDVIIIIYFLFYYIQVIAAWVLSLDPSKYSAIIDIGEERVLSQNETFIGMAMCWLGAFFSFAAFRLIGHKIFLKRSYFIANKSDTLLERKYISRAGTVVVIAIVGAIAAIQLSIIASGGFSALLDITSARLAKAEESYILLVGLLFLIPAIVSTFAIDMRPGRFWSLWLVSLIVAGLGGGRGATFILLFLAILRLILIDRRKIGIGWLFAAMAPAILALYAYTNIVRFRGESAKDSGILDFLVNSETFASWKSLAAVLQLDYWAPYPAYSFFSAIFYPFPRAIIPFKPDPPSSLFTMEISPTRFENTNSEITISGMGDMISNFGMLAGPIVFGLLLSLLASFACRIRSKGAGPGTAIYVAIIMFSMTFFRADAFGASRILWFLVLIVILQRSLGGVMKLLRMN